MQTIREARESSRESIARANKFLQSVHGDDPSIFPMVECEQPGCYTLIAREKARRLRAIDQRPRCKRCEAEAAVNRARKKGRSE